MMKRSRKSIRKKIAVTLSVILLIENFNPIIAWALTSGPSQPEFSSFEPVSSTNMVSEFTGDFTYNLPVLNIPGANEGGYALSLSYHSGSSPEEEASWVGYGWTLNPGAINRNKRGFPDDWNNKSVEYYNKSVPNKTVAAGASGNLEVFSLDLGAGLNGSIRYNNYKGFGYNAGIGLQLGKGVVSIGYNVSDGEGSFSLAVNPAALLHGNKDKSSTVKKGEKPRMKPGETKAERQARHKALKEYYKNNKPSASGKINLMGSSYGLFSFGSADHPLASADYTGQSYTLTPSLMLATPPQFGLSLGFFGSYSIQTNTEESDKTVHGYMYSKKFPVGGANEMSDYYTEKLTPYNKHDKFLGIPFSNADIFSVSGEALGGGFRLYNTSIGTFEPNQHESETDIFNLGVEFEAGLNFGGGADIGAGTQTLETSGWYNDRVGEGGFGGDEYNITRNNTVFFRFNNDMGGFLQYGNSDAAQRASISYVNTVPGAKSCRFDASSIGKTLSNTESMMRSSYLAFHTNSQIDELYPTTGIHYNAYTKDPSVNKLVNRSSGVNDQIGELSVVNEDGMRYTYGLPVYSRKERSIQVDVSDVGSTDGHLAYKDETSNTKFKVGEGYSGNNLNPYATSFLLTEITTSDYVDRTNDGPTDDDFGGWTRFVYKRACGSHNKMSADSIDYWYKWRVPYNGLLYSRNELSNTMDDMGSVTDGEKEIYYLDSIVTKTHVAAFETSPRNDGWDANHAASTASSSQSVHGTNQLKRLDRIKLFARGENGTLKLVKTVNFDYEKEPNSLSRGLPNSYPNYPNVPLTSSTPSGGGKLTLKRVWFDYEGVVEAKISPYQFFYTYPTVSYPAPYASLSNYGHSGALNFTENPNYDPYEFDAWGNYQVDGSNRYHNMMKWVDQKEPSNQFDPAAWQLKRIVLPSGGEIHVQYEQKDYCYVQDKEALAMVRLKDSPLNTLSKFYIDAEQDLGVTTGDLPRLRDEIKKLYVDNNKRIYFKFLYKLIYNGTPQIEDCNAEYITGYCNVSNVGVDPQGLYLELTSGGYSLPKQVCEDFVKAERRGKIGTNGVCDGTDPIDGSSPTSIIMNFLTFAGSLVNPGTMCESLNYPKSYLRIPLIKAKKGGGVRVKRLLTYDSGIETGAATLYGNEYIYKFKDDQTGELRSSGVATNEPASIREENATVNFLDRFEQSFINKIVAGRDKKQSEGPIGESIMPSPSVGYSQVIIKNIHSGKTNPGFTVKKFWTAKDYPVLVEMTDLDNSHSDYLPLPALLVNYYTNTTWASQGFSFKLNNMHGQVRSTETYSGDYNNIFDISKTTLVSSENFTYFQPGEQVPVTYDPLDPFAPKTTMPLGKEMDVAMESRKASDINNDLNVEFDADGGIFGIIVLPFGTFMPSLTFSQSEIYTHTTSKVINYPTIIKNVETFKDGMYHLAENLCFNPHTGKPIITRNTDGFNGLDLLASANHNGAYTSYTVPASFKYNAMSQKALNEEKFIPSSGSFNNSNVNINFIIDQSTSQKYLEFSLSNPASGGTVCDAMKSFVAGDLVKIYTHQPIPLSNPYEVFNIGDPTGNRLELLPTSYTAINSTIIASNAIVDIEILRSGRTNQLSQATGSVTTYSKAISSSSLTVNPIPTGIIYPRILFADLLTQKLNSGNSAVITPQDLTANYINISFRYPNGNCGPLTSNIYIIKDNLDITMYVEGLGNVPIPPYIPSKHQWVDYLNHNFLDSVNYDLQYETNNWVRENTNGISNFFYGDDCKCQIYSKAILNGPTMEYWQPPTCKSPVPPSPYNDSIPGDCLQNILTASPILPSSPLLKGFNLSRYDVEVDLVGNPNKFLTSVFSVHPNGNGDVFPPTLDNLFPNAGFRSVYGQFVLNASNQIEFVGLPFVPLTQGLPSDTIVAINANNHYNGAEALGSYYDDMYQKLMDHCQKKGCAMTFHQTQPLTGVFNIDPNTGMLQFNTTDNPCNPQIIDCINFCDVSYPSRTISNIVNCSARTFSDNWPYDKSKYYPPTSANQNLFETGERGKWRESASYSYKSENVAGFNIPYAYGTTAKNYNSGSFNMQEFNWQYPVASLINGEWLKLNTVNKYSPNGNVLEEQNILNIKSTAKFGYHETMPVLVAKNAEYNSVYFDSFENLYNDGTNNYLEDGAIYNTTDVTQVYSTSHSGKYALRLNTYGKGFQLPFFTQTSQTSAEGMIIKLWVKNSGVDEAIMLNGLNLFVKNGQGANLLTTNLIKVAQVGDWFLLQKTLTIPTSVQIGDKFGLVLKYDPAGNENVFIDDVRVQPTDAQMTTYVYDVKSLKLLTSFDDQHFGLFYQYNAEGKLVRKIAETERGKKTIKETQYHTVRVLR